MARRGMTALSECAPYPVCGGEACCKAQAGSANRRSSMAPQRDGGRKPASSPMEQGRGATAPLAESPTFADRTGRPLAMVCIEDVAAEAGVMSKLDRRMQIATF